MIYANLNFEAMNFICEIYNFINNKLEKKR